MLMHVTGHDKSGTRPRVTTFGHQPQPGLPSGHVLWVPKTSCHQVIFVEDAASAVAPPGPDMIQIGDSTRQWAERRGLV